MQPLGFAAKQLVLFAVNNNPDASVPGGGSHWSLLVYWAPDTTFRHFDSASGLNRQAAQAVYEAVRPSASSCRLVEARCPQQENGHDCGLYVLALARLLCQRFVAALERGGGLADALFDVTSSEVSQHTVSALRSQLHDLIEGKASEQQLQRGGG